MFNNKREIFSFRKYKAYGLASAVIAAFFLVGGVASADEVTAPTTTPAVAQRHLVKQALQLMKQVLQPTLQSVRVKHYLR